jgi:hypothetical protein
VTGIARYGDSLRAGRSGDRIPVWATFSAPVQTGLRDPFGTMGAETLSRGKAAGGVALTTLPHLWPRLRNA